MKMLFKSMLFLLLICTCSIGQAQDDQSRSGSKSTKSTKFSKADKQFNDLSYVRAIQLYEKALKNEKDPQAILNLADSYRLIDNTEMSEFWYAQVAESDMEPEYFLRYAQSLQSNLKLEEAKFWFEKYNIANPDDQRAAYAIKDISDLNRLLKDSAFYRIRNLKTNTEFSDFGPAFLADEGIVFSSERPSHYRSGNTHTWTDRPFLDLFYSEGIEGENEEWEDFSGKLNTKFHEGPMTFSADGKEIFFTRNNFLKGKKETDEEGTIKLKILTSRKEDKGWSDPKELPFNSDEYTVAHPTLSADGKALYFTSDKPGGFGQSDIYVSLRENNKWSEPVNLGAGVNTAGEESFPFIHSDGTLIYASDGLGGMGGLDVFQSTMDKEGHWNQPQNVGFPINTRKDDFGLVWNEARNIGYFASNRNGGKGSDDIYSVYSRAIHLRGIVYDRNTHERIEDAFVELIEVESTVSDRNTGERGDFVFNTIAEKEYRVRATAVGYNSNNQSIDLNGIKFPAYGYVEIPLARDGDPNSSIDIKPGMALGQVVDKNTKAPIAGATVLIQNKCEGTVKSLVTDDVGYYTFSLSEKCEYNLKAEKSGYVGAKDNFLSEKVVDPSELISIMELDVLKEGMTIELRNIYYDYDMDYIREDATEDLNHLNKLLENYPDMVIEIGSHTDARGSDSYNEDLSQRRAESVVNWLIKNGVDSKRLIARGYGENRVRNSCGNGIPCSDAAHQYNRRTEFVIAYLGKRVKSDDKRDIPVNTWKRADR